MLVWIDLETTGLNFDKEHILEVAAITTDDTFNEVSRYSSVVYFRHAQEIVETIAGLRALGYSPDDAAYKQRMTELAAHVDISPYVLEMHWKNGLWADCAKAVLTTSQIDEELAHFIRSTAQWSEPKKDNPSEIYVHKPPLAGSTISYDRQMMWGRLSASLKELHYRNVDVSTLNELGQRHWKDAYAARPNNEVKGHRGVTDIEESIRVCQHYVQNLVDTTTGTP